MAEKDKDIFDPKLLEEVDKSTTADLKSKITKLEVSAYTPPPSDRLSDDETNQVLTRYMRTYKLNPHQTLNSVSYWLQTGGYVRSVPNRKHAINTPNIIEELDTLRLVVREVRSTATLRQLARTLVSQINKMALVQGYPGHLYKTLQLTNPQLRDTDIYYCCEYYQGLTITPAIVNAALNERTLKRGKNSKQVNKTGNKK